METRFSSRPHFMVNVAYTYYYYIVEPMQTKFKDNQLNYKSSTCMYREA